MTRLAALVGIGVFSIVLILWLFVIQILIFIFNPPEWEHT